jgi:hypothetical protein
MLARMTIASQRKNNGKQKKNRYTDQKTVEIKQKKGETQKKKRLSIQHSIITTKRKNKIH